jgi:hypothetical protein
MHRTQFQKQKKTGAKPGDFLLCRGNRTRNGKQRNREKSDSFPAIARIMVRIGYAIATTAKLFTISKFRMIFVALIPVMNYYT